MQDSTISREPFKIPGANGVAIRGDVWLPADLTQRVPVIIFCHGFKGFKDWGGFPTLAQFFAQSGFAFIAFNFSHNGVGNNLTEFTELDLFEQNTYAKEAEDLRCVLRALNKGELPEADKLNVGAVGT